ncbi:MAG: alpha/beta hydrolase fold domain-containing protein [Fimbriiglobus sp.]
MCRWAWLLVLGLVGLTASAAEPSLTVKRDVLYSEIAGEKLRFDVAMPKGDGPFPCVVGLHGGAWKGGSRKDLSQPIRLIDFGVGDQSFIEALASEGFVAVSVSYRLAPQHKFPAQIIDAKTAIRYLRANAKEFKIDPERIGVVGFSAGGHLAALIGTTDKTAGFDEGVHAEQSSRVKCVVDLFGPADLSLYSETPGIEKAFMLPLLGASFAEKPELYKRASPVEYVTKDDPPFLLIHGTVDVVVPYVHSARLSKKLEETGVKCELVPMPRKGHGWFGDDAKASKDKILKFLASQLK